MRLFPLLAASLLAGCTSGIDITVTRGEISFHLDDTGCGVTFSGDRGAGPSAVDITCPANLRPRKGGPTLHISTPLVQNPGPSPLRDEHFQEPGYQLGQFVIVTYQIRDRRVICDPGKPGPDPQVARGTINYLAIPKFGTPGRLAGTFSDDAALIHCYARGADGREMDEPGPPLSLRGVFDLATPAGR
jgi:hypothetical protein